MKYYTVIALLPCIPFSWALSLFLLDHGALILGVGKVAKIVALPCLWAYLVFDTYTQPQQPCHLTST